MTLVPPRAHHHRVHGSTQPRADAATRAFPPWAAPALGATTFVLAGAAAIAAAVASGDALREDIVFLIMVGVVYPAVGTAVSARHPRNAIGWIFCLVGTTYSLQVLADKYARIGLVESPSSLPGASFMAWLAIWLWPVAIGVIGPLPLLLFPDGRPPSPRWRIVLGAALAGMVFAALALGVLTWEARGSALVSSATTSRALDRAYSFAVPGFLLLAASTVCSLVGLLVRFRRSRGAERKQLQLFTLAVTLFVALLFLNSLGVEVPELSLVTAGVLIPAAAGVAILKHGLFDLDLVINRSLVVAALGGILLVVYVVVVSALAAIVGDPVELGPQLAATAAVAALFAPVRSSLQRTVNRVMFGQRDDPYAVISRLGRRLEAAPAGAHALQSIVETVQEGLRLPYVAIELAPGPGIVAAAGRGTAEEERFPLLHQGRTLGSLVVHLRGAGQAFSSTERTLLFDLARRAGAAVDAARLTAELQRSRELLVAAREEERRRLRRELHDGLGPALAGVRLDLAQVVQHASAPQVAAIVERVRADLGQAVADVRRLAYDLRPPALDEVGLVAALRQRVEELSIEAPGGGLAVSVSAEGALESLPAAVEVAAYRIAAEAVANVVRHARARSCSVRLAIGIELALEVMDDGCGLAADWRPGVGVASMRERAMELGGSLTVGPGPAGGTVVQARLPLVAPA